MFIHFFNLVNLSTILQTQRLYSLYGSMQQQSHGNSAASSPSGVGGRNRQLDLRRELQEHNDLDESLGKAPLLPHVCWIVCVTVLILFRLLVHVGAGSAALALASTSRPAPCDTSSSAPHRCCNVVSSWLLMRWLVRSRVGFPTVVLEHW